jgi:hypothetical protein
MNRLKYIVLLALLLLAGQAEARINVVTLPGRDSVQLTIYNSVDLTVVVERRVLTFRKGSNRLEFSWANTLIDPTSVEFRALSHADAVEVLDVRFPPRVSNTLEWHVQSEFSGEVEVEIRYFTSGIGWSADYVADVSADESAMKLAGHVRVSNQSGEDYENAQIRLVLGEIKLVQEIAALAGKPAHFTKDTLSKDKQKLMEIDSLLPALKTELSAKMVSNESLSEYFLYTIEGRDTIPNGWSKRLPALSSSGVPITSLYKFESDIYGDEAIRFFQFTNNIPSKLGKEPLPDGEIKAFRLGAGNSLQYMGSSSIKYIPINEQVEVSLGNDEEVQVRPKATQWVKQDLRFDNNGDVSGWTIKETFTIEVQNSKSIPAVVDVRRGFSGDWTLESADKYTNVDATKVKFLLSLPPHTTKSVTYTVTLRQGTNATR